MKQLTIRQLMLGMASVIIAQPSAQATESSIVGLAKQAQIAQRSEHLRYKGIKKQLAQIHQTINIKKGSGQSIVWQGKMPQVLAVEEYKVVWSCGANDYFSEFSTGPQIILKFSQSSAHTGAMANAYCLFSKTGVHDAYDCVCESAQPIENPVLGVEELNHALAGYPGRVICTWANPSEGHYDRLSALSRAQLRPLKYSYEQFNAQETVPYSDANSCQQ